MINARCVFGPSPRVVVCLVSLSLAGCQRHPKMVDTLGTAIDDAQVNYRCDPRELAPFVVLASVEENRVIAAHVEAARYEGVYLDLHAVRCKREISLKGGLTGPDLEFFYFADGYREYPGSKPNPRYKRLFQANPGSRYLFFLTRDRDLLRSIGDVGEYSIPVATGFHSGDLPKGRVVGSHISEVLLVPGNGANLGLLAKQLLDYSNIADDWGSRLLTVQLLRNLASAPEPVRSQACGVLVAKYHGQWDCLQALAGDVNEPPAVRAEASRELKEQGGVRQRLLDDLQDPARLAYMDAAGDSRRRLREELQTLLLARDAALNERACAALKRYYPYDTDPMCLTTK